jgi:dolichyl-phosphate beta-glucosyltransferase
MAFRDLPGRLYVTRTCAAMNRRPPVRLQLVIPCYNEAARLDIDAFTTFARTRPDVELLFVDDGSTDGTAAILRDLAATSNGRIHATMLPRNVGKAGAVYHGIATALRQQPELIGYWDSDLATPLAALDEFIDVLDANPQIDIVMGARVKLLGRQVDRRALRHYAGRVFATAAALALGVEVYDTQCGAKIFRVTAAVKQIFATPFRSRWVFDVELLARYTTAAGGDAAVRIYELPLKTWTDVAGSKVRAWHILRATWDMVRIWQRSGR